MSGKKTELEAVVTKILDTGKMARLSQNWEKDPHIHLYVGFAPKVAVYVERWVSWKSGIHFPYEDIKVPPRLLTVAQKQKMPWELWVYRNDMKCGVALGGKIIGKYKGVVPTKEAIDLGRELCL